MFKCSFTLRFALILCLASAAALQAAMDPQAPEYFPTCPAPQPAAPVQPVGGGRVGNRTAVVWNGQDFATLYADGTDNALHFRRFFADGTPAAAAVTVSAAEGAFSSEAPALLWNGSGYAAAWTSNETPRSIYFALLSGAGTRTVGPVPVEPFTTDATQPSLAWSGARYAVSYTRFFGGTDWDIFGALLDNSGVVTNPILSFANTGRDERFSTVVWNGSGGQFHLFWRDYNSAGPVYLLAFSRLASDGTIIPIGGYLPSATAYNSPTMISTPGGMAVAYEYYYTGQNRIYFSRIDASGSLLTPFEVTSGALYSAWSPRIVWTGAEYEVIWEQGGGGFPETWIQRVTAGGSLAGANSQISFPGGNSYPDAAFGRYGLLLTGAPYASPQIANLLQPLACAADATPPSCPANLIAYGITGTTASVSWSPALDTASDLAYYQVYRNNIPIAKTSDAFYNDISLPLSSMNNYMIQPVNALQLQNAACTTSIYVSTNATPILTLNKATPDAVLNWTDAGFNSYNIFRGNDPRVMSQIGATPSRTAPDPSALNDGISHFYSVDNPGP